MSLLTITAGRVLRISPPMEESNATHQMSPRRGCSTDVIGDVTDETLAPLEGFRLPRFVGRHGAISLFEALVCHMRTRQIVHEPTDAASPDNRVETFVYIGVHGDRQLLLHTYNIRISPPQG